jgi:hypothetical protein
MTTPTKETLEERYKRETAMSVTGGNPTFTDWLKSELTNETNALHEAEKEIKRLREIEWQCKELCK